MIRFAPVAILLIAALTPSSLWAQAPSTMWRVAQLPTYEPFERHELTTELDDWPEAPKPSDAWTHQLLPEGLIFDSYLAGTKESRFSLHWLNSTDDSFLFDGTLGTRIGIWRYGTTDAFRPEGWQLDIEGSGQIRLDMPNERDVRSVDFRAGIPMSYGVGPHRVKFGYYHLSSHVGDEFLIKNPGFNRLNYSRDVFVLGYSYYLSERLRLYGEAGWAFYLDVSKPWEFQFGIDFAPACETGFHGAPFWAMNVQMREEVNFGGAFVFQAGWAWRGANANMLRTGLVYYNGESSQFSFYDEHEQQIGFGLWYDF